MQELEATGLCPICRGEIAALVAGTGPAEARRQCARCDTWYHQDCWEYAGGCGIFGCEPVTNPRACPPPGAPLSFPDRLIARGSGLALGMLTFLLGAFLGLLSWGLSGGLAIPILLLINFFADSRNETPRGMLLRRSVVFGPIGVIAFPFPMLLFAAVPIGVALVLAGHGIKFARAHRAVAMLCAAAVGGTLAWSHLPPPASIPFHQVPNVPRWARHGTTPAVYGPNVRTLWHMGVHLDQRRVTSLAMDRCSLCKSLGRPDPLPTREIYAELEALNQVPIGCSISPWLAPDRRIVVLPRGAQNIEVTRQGDRIRIRHGASAMNQLVEFFFLSWFYAEVRYSNRREAVAISIPNGPELVDVRSRGVMATVLGPRLDELLVNGGSEPRIIASAGTITPEERREILTRYK